MAAKKTRGRREGTAAGGPEKGHGHGDDPQSPADPPRKSRFVVVGVGASAGGLEALGEMLEHVPAGCGMAFVIVSHLDPERSSLMGELLGRHTQLPVATAVEGMEVCADHVYVLPNDIPTCEVQASLSCAGAGARLRPDRPPHGRAFCARAR